MSILPLTAVVEQAASTLVVCFCEETVDHEANQSPFRRLVLPPHLHSCLNDSLNITVHYQAHQQKLARERERERAEQHALEAQPAHAPATLPVTQFDMQHGQRDSSAQSDAEERQAGARQSVAFGHVQELRRSTTRSVASVFPVSAMRTTPGTAQGQDVVPGIG